MRTGKIVRGHVLDCNKKYLERALKDYDSQLYLEWNPKKANGMGMWELWRTPNTKTAVPRWEIGNQIVFDLQYVPNDLIHHVMDLPVLNYNCLNRLKEMDTWGIKDWVNDLEYREAAAKEKEFKNNREDLTYAIKQYRRAFADLREEIRSGRNPADFLEGNW